MKKAVIILICALMFTSMMVVPGNTGDVEASTPADTVSALTPHAPIRIDSNADFGIGINGVSAGDGSAGNPWIIENWDINGTGFGYCLYIGNTTEHFVVRNSSFHEANGVDSDPYFSDTGVIIANIMNGAFHDNNISSNSEQGIYLINSSNNTIYNNSLVLNALRGINIIDSSDNNTITNNTLLNNYDSINIISSVNNVIDSNHINDVTMPANDQGIRLWNANKTIITNNTILNHHSGIFLVNSENNTVSLNMIDFSSYSGIYLSKSHNNDISNNTVLNTTGLGYGITIFTSTKNSFIYNTILFNSYGMIFSSSDSNYASFNNVSHNERYGIQLIRSRYIHLDNNSMFSDEIYISGDFLEQWNNHNITTSNKVNDKPVYYWKNQTQGAVPADAGQVILVNCSNIIVKDLEIGDVYGGVTIGYASNITVDNILFDNGTNIFMSYHSNNNSIKNSLTTNSGGGFYFSNSSYNDVSNISSINCSWGLILSDYSKNNTFYESNFICNGNGDGIQLYEATNNIFYNNTISQNVKGLDIYPDANNNYFYHNSIIGNTIQAEDDGNNHWDNSYPSGGNYWGDYTGSDTFSGPDQDMPGSDGIGDTPYISITGTANAIDNYPYIYPFNGTIPQYLDSLAPNSTVLSITPYWHNSPLNISANATDNGSYVKNVTLFYRGSLDNTTWDAWTKFSTDAEFPWNFTFDFPDGEAYYQLYTIARDAFNNTELAPTTADAFLAHDTTLPESEIFQPDKFWLDNRTIYLDWTANDTIGSITSGFGPLNTTTPFHRHDNVDMWMRYSADNSTWGGWALVVEDIWNGSLFNHTVLQDGYYQFYSLATDLANNTELAPLAGHDVFLGVDTTAPLAAAGDDQDISQFSQATFDASNSTDNIGIVNYSWTFTYASQDLVVNRDKFNFTFNHYGSYPITLVVLDGAGNSATDILWVNVSDDESPIPDAGADQQSDPNLWITFDGSGSTDNVGIQTYTWTFVYNGTTVTLDGMYPKFKFEKHGTYDVTLTVTDEAGNSATDTMQVFIAEDITQSGSSYVWIIVLFVLVLIVAALGIMAFYFKKGARTQLDERDREEARSYRDDEYEFDDDGYEDDGRYR